MTILPLDMTSITINIPNHEVSFFKKMIAKIGSDVYGLPSWEIYPDSQYITIDAVR